MFTIENVISDVSLSQDGCAEREDGLVMIDSGASVNVCPKWFGKSKLQKSDDATRLRGADGRLLQEYGERQIWLKIGGTTKRYVLGLFSHQILISCLWAFVKHKLEGLLQPL